jgi:hypothetical protein
MYGQPQLKHLNLTNHRDQQRRAKEARDKAEEHASSIEYDDERGHGISEEETVVSDQAI